MNLSSILLIVWAAAILYGVVRIIIMMKEAVRRSRDKAVVSKSYMPAGAKDVGIKNPPVSPEEEYYANIYCKKKKIPADALQRSNYVAWLLKEELYEEADRVLSMKI